MSQVTLAGKKIEKSRKYGVDLGERGIYDTRNPLNELTGKEWTYFIKSVHVTDYPDEELKLWGYLNDSLIQTMYSTNGNESHGHNLRKIHPSPKPPQLMAELINFFTMGNQWVLDPFMGVGGTLLGASLLSPKRNAVGIDLEPNYIEIYKKVCGQEHLKEQTSVVGDARTLDDYPEVNERKFDLILTDPPYAMMLSKKRTGGSRKKGTGYSTPFTESPLDLGNLDYRGFLKELRKIIGNTIKFLKNKKYLVIFCKDLQPTKEHHNMLHADIVREFSKINDIQFKGYKIWYDKTINLYPYGYPFSFVANQLHQYILIFRKEV